MTALCLLALALTASAAHAANPRWTTGPPYFNVWGIPVTWYTNQPLYYTDPGDLSAYVDHPTADAMVAAAAATWNVPQSMMVLQQGGSLNEQVSGANVYLSSSGLVYPADVQSTNYLSKQIAVIYDRDGSVTDLLLGGAASDPSGCLQNAVTESVDSINPSGNILHAVVILNGRCTTADPESLLQMQYQLERIFGRILGVGWSQANDNVFTGTPSPTYNQVLHWPIMHPIDVVCATYTYHCMTEPFTLRDDDIAALALLYPVTANGIPGKQPTLAAAGTLQGNIRFPILEGMAGVNVVVRRNNLPSQVIDAFDDVSAVTGDYAQQIGGNPITPKPTSGIAASFGELPLYYDVAGFFDIAYIPIPPDDVALDILMHTEAINPLYTGEYGIGSHTLSTVAPAGSSTWRFNYMTPYWNLYYEPSITYAAANTCSTRSDGTEAAPSAMPATGWWNGLICGTNASNSWSFAHTSWVNLPVQANRSLTVEATALDQSGNATTTKVRPILGVWSASDALGSPPSLASAGVAFNTVVLGTTAATASFAHADTPRIAFTSETGEGRPDYNYQARVLYADSIAPASASAGTQITLSGTGFRSGNTVTIGGVLASVVSWTANTIVATVPRLSSVAPGGTATVDVIVTDLSTHGATTMSAAFQYIYTAPVYIMQVVTAPAAAQIVSLSAAPAFAVRVTDADSVTPLANSPVVFSTLTGSVSWSACPAATCTVLTDSTGLASITATPLAAGTVTLQAATLNLTQQASFQAVPLVRTAAVAPQYKYLTAGTTGSWPVTATFTQQALPAASAPVVWTSAGASLSISSAQTSTGSTGTAQATVTAGPLAAGAQATGTACAWSTTCATFTAIGVATTQLLIVVTGNGAQSIPLAASFLPVILQVTDLNGNPVAGAAVSVHQTTRLWTAPCTGKGRCATAPVYSTSISTLTSDLNGNLSIVPLDMGGAEVTSIVASCGNLGYASISLQRHP